MQVIKARYGLDATNVGDEGGFAPSIGSAGGNFEPAIETLDLIMEAIDQAGCITAAACRCLTLSPPFLNLSQMVCC